MPNFTYDDDSEAFVAVSCCEHGKTVTEDNPCALCDGQLELFEN